ncbi:SDR family oxidoreductase [Saccharopolyspora sp. K220]|uniref:SDR family NAD(P)-dependent oxidoreductase n=1 Tax=Saccharopolyspora soli TaxID=2926618 RepID=UPI001F57C700|nr:SDR family NAD(P)-dependent oxidoreductase [Saccharopolyspora soli]MCI2416458.1 SDR family oxidoreductase [Saccharopolyspora soli]
MRATRELALVTGSSSGIGAATAHELAVRGFDVVLNGLPGAVTPQQLEERAAEIRATGVEAIPVVADVGEDDGVAALGEAVDHHSGRLAVLVNNAGTGLTKPVEDIAAEDWDRLFAVHAKAHFRLATRCSAALKAAGGAVVNVSSVAAKVGLPGRAAYSATKAAIEGFTRALAGEWARDGVRVNAVAPGTIRTPLVERNFQRGLLDPDMVLARTPMGRFGTAEEVAKVIAFLAGPDASYVTGQTIYVDGGWTAWGG